MISLSKINFAYDEPGIIHNLSLEIRPGSFTGIIGPNGAGKTTLLKLISGILKPSSGFIQIDNKDIRAYSRGDMARRVAVVPQVEPFAFAFTALEVVLMGRAPYLKHFGFETERDTQIAREVMVKTDTWQFKDRKIDELSGGERQRVLVARALAQEPKILLLDEPTTFLDIAHQLDIMEIVSGLNQRHGMTVIAAMHDINLAITFCSEIALLHGGSVFEYGRPEDVITYANLKKIFGAEVYVGVNEFTGKPYYVPMDKRDGSDIS